MKEMDTNEVRRFL